MLSTLIIGLGRAGRELHLPVLLRAREQALASGLFASDPVVVLDPFDGARDPAQTVRARTLAHAALLVDPAATVAHLCTPPATRVELLDELGRRGFRNVIVEKPLAVDAADADAIMGLRERWGLRLIVVAPWLASTLTARIGALLDGRELGTLRAIYIVQRKPRFTRSLLTTSHHSAFDVELPHSLALVLRLAGPAAVVDATASDLCSEDAVIQGMGGAAVSLQHASGVHSEIRSDMGAMLRERRITLELDRGTLVGHYPSSADDHTAQLCCTIGLTAQRTRFRDDALMRFGLDAYARFAAQSVDDEALELQAEVVRMLGVAKRRACAAGGGEQPALQAPAIDGQHAR